MTCETFSFKKEAKLYVVYGGNRHRIDISAVTFSQTYTESTFSRKTIQDPKMFEGSVINKANPANFEVTFPAIREDDLRILFDRALDYQPFDIYVETRSDVFFIDYCVISAGVLVIERTRPLSMTVSGSASRLSRFGDPGITIPGTPVPRDASMTYNRISDMSIQLDGVDISELLTSVSIALENEVNWTPWVTVDGAIEAEANETAMYPVHYTIANRTLSGEMVQYLTDEDDILDWSTDVPLHILAGQVSGSFYGFELDLSNCSFTNALRTGPIFLQTYNWRLTQNPTNLSDIITYHVSL